MVADPVNVWILGSSIIKQATVAASQRIGGTNLSIPNANIWWQRYSGMKLLDLVPKLKYLKGLKLQSPHIIVVHCGANNVGKTRLDRLLTLYMTFCLNLKHYSQKPNLCGPLPSPG